MTAVRVGSVIADNNPRSGARLLKIVELVYSAPFPEQLNYVVAKPRRGLFVRISADRIYTDGKPRRTGFSVVVLPLGVHRA